MIKCYLDLEHDGLFHFKIGKDTPYFDDLLEIFKKYYCKYSYGEWCIKPTLNAKNLYDELKQYSDIDISAEDLDLIENLAYPPSNELKKIKYSIDKNLLELHPPLKGVEGYEDYQKIATKDFVQKNRCFLNLAPRLGKSYISIIGFGTLMNLGQLDVVLGIMRTEGLVNYKNEILNFLPFIKEDDIEIITKDNRNIEDYFDTKKIILMSYNTWRLCNEYYINQKYKSGKKPKKPKKPVIDFSKWGTKRLIICDEAQALLGDTLQSYYTMLHRDFFERRCVMSGSIGFALEKTFNLAKFLTPERVPYTKSEWWKYVTDEGYSPWNRPINPTRLKEYEDSVLNPLMTSFTSDVLPQVDSYDYTLYCEMTSKMREYYKQVCNKVIVQVAKDNNGEIKLKNIKEKFPYLRQVTDDPSLLEMPNWDMKKDNPKIELLESFLEKKIDEEKRQVILWCSSPRTMAELGKIFKKYNPMVINGDEKLCGIKREDRDKAIKELQTTTTHKLLITNQVLSTSVSFWNYSVNVWWIPPLSADFKIQSQMRIKGCNQKRDVENVTLCFNHSVDLYIKNMVENKINIKNYFDNGDKNLSMTELSDIINPKNSYLTDGSLNPYN